MKYVGVMVGLFFIITIARPLESTWRGDGRLLRKLLMEGDDELTTTKETPEQPTDPTHLDPISSAWAYLTATAITAVIISLFIALAIKCRFFQRYLASYRHSLLPEGDQASQYGPDEVTFPGHGMVGRVGEAGGTQRGIDYEDDDGFIEDNYIQASKRARVEQAREDEEEGVEDSDDDLQLTIA